jgi:acetylornithine deacetylase
MNDISAINILADLTGILSESGTEKEIASYIETWLTKHTNHETTRVGDNILVYIPGKNQKKCLLFNGHIDTVKIGDRENWKTDPLKLTEKDGKLYGLGTSDMKGAIAAMMEMTTGYSNEPPACDIYCMFVVEEETTGNGTNDALNYLKPLLKKYDDVAAIVGESTSLNAVLGHRGNAFVRATFQGQGGHASRPPELANQAIHKALIFLESIEKQQAAWSATYTDPLLGSINITSTGLEAGTGAMNQIPTNAAVILDVRTVPTFHAKLEKELETWGNAFGAKIEIIDPYPVGFCDPSEKIAQVVMRLASQKEVQVTQGATDQQFFTRANIPAVICGPGEKSTIHAPNEYIKKSLLESCAARYADIVAAWAASFYKI